MLNLININIFSSTVFGILILVSIFIKFKAKVLVVLVAQIIGFVDLSILRQFTFTGVSNICLYRNILSALVPTYRMPSNCGPHLQNI